MPLRPKKAKKATANPVSFRRFIEIVNPHYKFYPHVEPLIAALQRVADGSLKRLMVFMPPRHGKSELVSRLFPAYMLYRFPEKWIAIASYAAGLAYTLSRNARDYYTMAGGALKQDARGVEQWETGGGGGLWATGVGGPATGKGMDGGILDDPLKNAEEAASETIREKQKEWWQSTWYTRQSPDAFLVVVQTRWNEDDLSGWLLAEEESEDAHAERWHIINMPAIAEGDGTAFPLSCTVEPDYRNEGEALCAERYPLSRLESIRAKVGAYFWGALYQQRPSPREGNIFKLAWFEIVNAVPRQAQRVRWWDKAATQDGGDYTAGVLIAHLNGMWYIEDVVRGQWSSHERDKVIVQTAALDAEQYQGTVHIWSEQEPGSSGKDAAGAFVRMLSGYTVSTEPTTGDKVTMADPFASQCEAGNVKIKKAAWNRAYLDELTAFPTGKHDDQVDASARGFSKLSVAGAWRRSRRAA